MYAVKAERERKNGSVTGRKRNIMAGKAGAPAAALQQTRRAGLNVGDVSINYRTAPAGDTGVVQRKRRAVLGRRVEPYKEDIEGFIAVCKSKEVKNKEEYVGRMIRKAPKKSSTSNDDRKISGTEYECMNVSNKDLYKNSVNVWVKGKICEHPSEESKINEYKERILNIRDWTIEKNQNWIRTGAVDGEHNSSAESSFGGIDGRCQFRLVGLDSKGNTEDRIFAEATKEYPYCKKSGGAFKKIKFHELKKESFTDETQKALYEKTLISNQKKEGKNFIAYVMKYLQKSLLLSTQRVPAGVIRGVIRFPTVLAQEIEQLDEANYKFATISSAAGEKVIALPGAEAEKFQESARTQEARTNGSEVPEESTGLDVPETLEELAGWAVADKV